jgi:hypothetical protein
MIEWVERFSWEFSNKGKLNSESKTKTWLSQAELLFDMHYSLCYKTGTIDVLYSSREVEGPTL